MTQGQLAEATGISQSQLSQYLKASKAPNLDELEAVCTALGVVADEVLREARIYSVSSPAEREDLRRAIERNDPRTPPAPPITDDKPGQTGT